MGDDDPKSNNPLSPYYPSEAPDIPSNGRTWFAILLTLILLFGTVYGFVSMLV
ncbi:hypothetical protein [Halorubrum sp. DTA46]|uniref:hypothetical protein n=1 Tax=Halorubrum sp. DTA46 TaxID=3402162 RepID=UPI003AAFC6E1